jgi:hypothetical protein
LFLQLAIGATLRRLSTIIHLSNIRCNFQIYFNSKPILCHPSTSFTLFYPFPPTTNVIMARSLRSKRKQANKRKRRADVFAPVEAARTARLAAAQKKIADTPKKADESKKADEPKKVDEAKSVEESMVASREATPMEDDTPQNGSQSPFEEIPDSNTNRA